MSLTIVIALDMHWYRCIYTQEHTHGMGVERKTEIFMK